MSSGNLAANDRRQAAARSTYWLIDSLQSCLVKFMSAFSAGADEITGIVARQNARDAHTGGLNN
jgi:hypothetical protein